MNFLILNYVYKNFLERIGLSRELVSKIVTKIFDAEEKSFRYNRNSVKINK